MKLIITIFSLAAFTSLVTANCKICAGNTAGCVGDGNICSNEYKSIKGGFLFYKICCEDTGFPSVSCNHKGECND
ncbi:uncharacterized protein CLAFUR5_10648 [Fulvia fulva]|uniref:Putative effector 23 n=1 Tax=Passalora fulva TaxID=5499 RepID=A0A1P8YXJ9_PASFU|nr:uncharacterized protein CLAFUR5_10648 [Fulvia fulva]AQA29226.1 putative effector 23 [Fulvia fulva]KAK4619838.1 hypothetical protein CLAFUR4_11608 [Fulvia fulva]KAK4620508.1 hypothetical protein CLAFUR0_11617 [Fulvia fulva]UJO20058.1 hypothetical protein CLAFUR5_10648 [Fulvia fulva]